ncbi:flagellin [Mycoplana sp. BE70]|nr:flagellin [Mycoplana sp. BE70]
MTSIHTNAGAIAALQTLRALDSNSQKVQGQVSTGMRIAVASDNAAYWSISTTMRSDNMALSAVSDALGLGAAKIDAAYAGMEAVVDVLQMFKAKLVAASEDGVDKAKIQQELEQFKNQILSIAQSSSFNGVNYLSTDIEDIYDSQMNAATVVSAYVRDSENAVSVEKTSFKLLDISLFNSTGGGLLQKDPRDVKNIGGIRVWEYRSSEAVKWEGWSDQYKQSGANASINIPYTLPLSFDAPGAEIRFKITVDADNPAQGLPGPLEPGQTTEIIIDRSIVDAALPAANGVISTHDDYAKVLEEALTFFGAAASARANTYYPPFPFLVQKSIDISTDDSLGLPGTYVGITDFTSNVGAQDINGLSSWGRGGWSLPLSFKPFVVYEESLISFNFSLNGAAPTSHSFDREYVNSLLGIDDGKIRTPEDMVTLLQSLIGQPGLQIEVSGSGVLVRTDPAVHRAAGSGTSLGFSNIHYNLEPLPDINLMDIDIVNGSRPLEEDIDYIEAVLGRVTNGASILGSIKSRIEFQTEFSKKMHDVIDGSIGRLVDADMNEASTRLKAVQAQQQLAVQSLSIANSSSEGIMQLFR